MAERRTQFSLAVVGAMNPAIHTPDWYRLLNLITQEELDQAKARPDLLCTRFAAQFTAGDLTLNCAGDKWLIATAKTSQIERATQVACETFRSLYHTPVSAFGTNFNCHVESDRSVAPVLAAKMAGVVAENALSTASIRYSLTEGRRMINVTVEPSTVGDRWVYVAINYHYDLASDQVVHFDLEPLIRAAVAKDGTDSQTRLDRLLKALEVG